MVTSPAVEPEINREFAVTNSDDIETVLLDKYLDQIATSTEFARSDRMVDLLRYVVARSVACDKGALSERAIGCVVFGRSEDWDPSIDTIVRSEIRRLRQKLAAYYEGVGATDPLKILVPKGGYAPKFLMCREPVSHSVESFAVLPQESLISNARVIPPYRWIAGGVALAMFVYAVLWLLLLAPKQLSPILANSTFATTRFTSDIGTEYSPAVSPDGKLVAYVWDNQVAPPDIYVRSVDRAVSHRLIGVPGTRLFPSWSPDGNELAFLEVVGDSVYVTVHSVLDESQKRVTQISKLRGRWADDESPLIGDLGPVWTPDGRALLVSDHDVSHGEGGLYRVNLDGKRSLLIPARGEDQFLYPRISPDGSHMAFVRYSSHGVSDLFIASIADRIPRQLTSDGKTISGLSWQPNGHSLIFSSNRSGSYQLWSINLAGRELAAVPTNSSSASEPAIAPSSNWIVYVEANQNWNIWRRPISGFKVGAPERLIASSGKNYDARYSPDGSRIAFVSDRSGSMEIWITDAGNNNPQQLTQLRSAWLGGIAWSPRGDQIAFDARADGHSGIFIIDASGGSPKRLDRNSFEERMPSWSADGKDIFFNSNRDGSLAIWKHSLVDGLTTRVSPYGMFASAATPSTLFFSTRSGEIWSGLLNGQNAQPLQGSVRADPAISWYLRGSDLFIATTGQDGLGYRIFRKMDRKTSLLAIGRDTLVPNMPDIAVSPDGRWLLYSTQDRLESDLWVRRTQHP